MDDERGYNGYPNYATWCVVLWLMGNDQRVYHKATDMVRGLSPRAAAVALQAFTDDLCGQGYGLRGDLLTHAQRTKTPYYALLRQVDWAHVVEAFRDE